MRGLAGFVLAGLLGACFDEEELTQDLPCTEDSHCGGDLRCLPGTGGPGTCDNPDDASSGMTTVAMTDASASSAESACISEGQSCAGGQACCVGICADFGGNQVCAQSCSSGAECASTCCCEPLADLSGSACVATANCGLEAACLSAGCASPGSQCYSDTECCGGRCSLNGAGTANQCFKTCTVPTDCVSGCCNFHPELGASLCEAGC